MSVGSQVTSDHQLARLLQLGVVLEELVEARAYYHAESIDHDDGPDPAVRELLKETQAESARHRERLEELIEGLDAESVPYDEIEALVEETYGRTSPEDFDGILYDQLANEETAYKFYDDLIGAIEASDARFSIDREDLLDALATLREEEAEGVEAVTRLMDDID